MYWYVRIENEVKGPFPEKQVQESVLLGRFELSTSVSKDREDWLPLRTFPELIPDVMKADISDPASRERLAAAKRWADERRGERRESDDPVRTGAGRREPEPEPVKQYRAHREILAGELKPASERGLWGLVFTILLLLLGAYAGFTLIPPAVQSADCQAPAAPGVNWNHCQLPDAQYLNQDFSAAHMNSTNLHNANLFGSKFNDADLSYADLSNANLRYTTLVNTKLKGANLRSSAVANASLVNVDLSYANLTGVNIENASFKKVTLDNAIWVDGTVCAASSVDRCQPK